MREYRTRDKAGWGAGPWQQEPDKMQWRDDATGLDCLIVRGPSGALCGYVGVPESHPWHKVGYGGCVRACGEMWCDHSPESLVSVHGGLTFADECQPGDEAAWEEWKKRGVELAARPELTRDYNAWREHQESTAICHVPESGQSDHVWWFGFDCAHSGDLCPKHGNEWRGFYGDSPEYRDLAYVREQVASLAAQLASAPSVSPSPSDAGRE